MNGAVHKEGTTLKCHILCIHTRIEFCLHFRVIAPWSPSLDSKWKIPAYNFSFPLSNFFFLLLLHSLYFSITLLSLGNRTHRLSWVPIYVCTVFFETYFKLLKDRNYLYILLLFFSNLWPDVVPFFGNICYFWLSLFPFLPLLLVITSHILSGKLSHFHLVKNSV